MRKVGLQVGMGVIVLSAAIGAAVAQGANRVSVQVSGLRNDNGVVRCGLYADASAFGQPGREFRGTVARINNQRATCVFTGVPAGRYAVAVFHAEHGETRMTTGTFGRPQQGYGFTGGAMMPNFSSAAFDYQGGNHAVAVRLTYGS